jgi:lactoylglutathione lyase
MAKLNLIVLRASDISITVTFYRALGLEFVQEQHGTGPVHYACESEGLVIEIYPGKAGNAIDRKQAGAVTLGFQVSDLGNTLETLKTLNVMIVNEAQTTNWGLRAVVQDPDGRAVDLTQLAH